MASKYENWSLEQIRKELKKRGAKTSGRKADCVERLEAYDRNDNFGTQPDVADPHVYKVQLPNIETYKDLNTAAKILAVGEAAVNQYLQPHSKTLGNENRLWKSRFLRFVRWSQPAVDDKTYLRGNCRAEMRKSVTYNVDVVVDTHGNVRQTQCECAAGMGPNAHCKHVVCLLYALVQFFNSGNINTELTCTEKLQTFHKAKRYTGSPVKMGKIAFGRQKTSVTASKATAVNSAIRFDPRKPRYYQHRDYKKNYNDYVLNMSVNFSLSSPNMTVLQLVKPANPFALCLDHDYCHPMQQDVLLQYLKITKITPLECQKLEETTREQSRCKLWHEEKLHRLHSSQFGRICKATDRTDMEALARGYTMQTKLNTAPIRHGKTYESIAIQEYEKSSGNQTRPSGIFVNPKCPFIASSPDGIVDDELLIEVKCPYVAKDKPISPVTIPYLIEQDGHLTLNTKHDYYYQVQGQLYCADRSVCDFVIYTKVDIKIIRIKRDIQFIETMLMKLRNFFESYFKAAVLNKYLYRDYYSYEFGANRH